MVTKKEIKKLLSEFKGGTPFNWEILNCKFLIKENEGYIAIDYIGQGTCEDIYNGNYIKSIDIREEFLSYRGLGGSCNLKEATNKVFEKIKNNI